MGVNIEQFAMAAAAGINTDVFTVREAAFFTNQTTAQLDPILIGGIITIAVNFIKTCQERKNPNAETAYDNAQAEYDDDPVRSRNQVKHAVNRAGYQKGINLSGRTARAFADSIIEQGLQMSRLEVTEFCTAV